jgi:putative membrane protein
MALQRTRMNADSTLMSVIRTSLSLIGFGFTIFQFFRKFKEAGALEHTSPRNFGLALVFLGVGMLIIGIIYHVQFMLGLRVERRELIEMGLIHGKRRFPVSFTLLVAVLLLVIGIAAIVSMTLDIAPFN